MTHNIDNFSKSAQLVIDRYSYHLSQIEKAKQSLIIISRMMQCYLSKELFPVIRGTHALCVHILNNAIDAYEIYHKVLEPLYKIIEFDYSFELQTTKPCIEQILALHNMLDSQVRDLDKRLIEVLGT